MTTVFEDNLLLIVIALLIGIVIAWWAFRSTRRPARRDDTDRARLDADAAPAEPLRRTFEPVRPRDEPAQAAPTAAPLHDAAEPPPPRDRDTPEGNGLADEGAAAAADVTGQVLGVQVHSELSGASAPPDNLQLLKGVGPKLAEKLNENGITRYEQLARLSANEIDILDAQLGPFRGRIARDRIVEQASYLARGDREGFEAKFGKLGG